MAEQLPRGLLADPAMQRAMLLPVARRTYTDPGDDITEELSGLEFAAPGLLYDPIMGMAQTGAMLMGDMPVNPDVVTQTMLDAPLVSGLLSAATGAVPRGAVLGAFSGRGVSGMNDLPQYRTSDGYTFYQQKDGTLTDNADPEMSDMVFNSLDDLANDFGEMPLPVGKNEVTEKAATEFVEDFASFMDPSPEKLPDDVKIQRALNTQRRKKDIDLAANKSPTAALPGLLDDAVGGRVQVPAIDARNPVAINIRGDIFPGATVEDAVKAATEGGMTESQIAQAVVGFMSNRGKFMDQQLAKMTARKSGQLKKGAQKGPRLALDDLDLTVAIKEITSGPIGVYRKTSTKNKSGKTTYAFGRAQSLEGQDPSKGGYALFKYLVNYDGNVRGGKRGSWGVVDRDLSFDEVKALMNKKVGFDAFSSPATAALPGLLQDRSGNIDQRGLLSRTPRRRTNFPMRGLLGQRLYTATTPDGAI